MTGRPRLRIAAEQHKLAAETLTAKANKLSRDRFFAPFAIACATLTALAALAPYVICALGG